MGRLTLVLMRKFGGARPRPRQGIKNIHEKGSSLVKKLFVVFGVCVMLAACQATYEPGVLETAPSTSSGQAPSGSSKELSSSGQAGLKSNEPIRFYISLTFVDEKTREPVVADVTLPVDDDGDGDPKTGTRLDPPCIQVTGCEFSVPVDGQMYVYAIEADGYAIHSLGVRPHYDSEKRLTGEVPLIRLVPEDARSG